MANYTRAGYARHKGVDRSHITRLIAAGKLMIVEEAGETRVVDCTANDEEFSKPAHNRGKKKKS